MLHVNTLPLWKMDLAEGVLNHYIVHMSCLSGLNGMGLPIRRILGDPVFNGTVCQIGDEK